MSGRRSREAGEFWENVIDATCEYYSRIGIAEIQKTPEPMKPIRPLGNGKFIAHYEKRAQPDYKGTCAGGRSIVFEAKHTDADRLLQSVVSSEQEKRLNKHEKLGADCFVLVSFGFKEFFKVPWAVFRSMKEIYGRKYIKPEDLREYQIRYTGGVLKFLD
ncbi:MAG: Holliday junction resolvase RecU [Clostridia bacterium]|nr:Holliday junction resolvase RecU [Clostridia bacterium]